MRENKIASQDSSLIVQAFTPWKPCITLASQMTSDTPTRLDPWPSDHCLLGTTLSCRAWDSAGSAELQGQRLFNRLEMAACLKTPPPPPPAADWCTPLCLGRRGWVPSQVHARANILCKLWDRQTNRLCTTRGYLLETIMTANALLYCCISYGEYQFLLE